MGQLGTKFGKTGYKGEAGEAFIYEVLSHDQSVTDYRQDMVMQSQGIDFGIKKPDWRREYTLDSKNNLYIEKTYFAFKVEIESDNKAGWFFSSKADRIYHTNTYSGKYIYYDLNELRYYVTKKLILNDFSTFSIVKYNSDVLIHFQLDINTPNDIPISKII